MRKTMFLGCAVAAALLAGPVLAGPERDTIEEVTGFVGQMAVPMNTEEETAAMELDDAIRFEPLQSFDEMFLRDDVVFLMRHGPTDWSKLDVKNVAPTDCENQRIMSEDGRARMRALGQLLIFNDLKPAKIVVSEWCRNQQTVDELLTGMERLRPGVSNDIVRETSPDLNLLLSLQGAPNVTNLRDLITNWDGQEGDGPLLIVSHFTNIQELTEFSVYEGEVLVIDPDRRNRVLGYLRLRSSGPDVGHFDVDETEAIYNADGSLNENSDAIPDN